MSYLLMLALAACTAGPPPTPPAAMIPPPPPAPSTGALSTGQWQFEPHGGIGLATITPTTQCRLSYNTADHTNFSLNVTAGLMFIIISRGDSMFPGPADYNVQFQSARNNLTLKMRSDSGRGLMAPLLPSVNDPQQLLPQILPAGFTFTVSSPNGSHILSENIPPLSPFVMFPLTLCASWEQQKMRGQAKPAGQ